MSIPAWFAPRQETMIGRCATTGMILTILSVLLGCGEQGAEPPKPPSPVEVAPQAAFTHAIHPPPAVRERLRTEPATRRAVPELVTAPGEVALDLKKVAKITSRIGGQVEHIHVQLGDRVKPAQPLAAIGSLQLDQLVEEYLVGKAQADVAENSLRRTEKLRTDDIVPERKLIEDKGHYLETKARYQHVREKLLAMGISKAELAGLERGGHEEGHHYTLTSPIAGQWWPRMRCADRGSRPEQNSSKSSIPAVSGSLPTCPSNRLENSKRATWARSRRKAAR
jgi:multidrug efflux pump subunit AcrA (membrane-fusion protein)